MHYIPTVGVSRTDPRSREVERNRSSDPANEQFAAHQRLFTPVTSSRLEQSAAILDKPHFMNRPLEEDRQKAARFSGEDGRDL